MRLVAWNCRSAFHRKVERLRGLEPDIAIVAECATPEILARKAPTLAPTSALWVGSNPHAGLGVFSFGGCLAPLRMATRRPTLRALSAYRRFLRAEPAIVAGDLNNHVRWDRPGKAWNQARATSACARLGLVSAYHAFEGVAPGAERHPTFYWRTRSSDGRTYHIDYVFVPRTSVGRLRSVTIGSHSHWIATGLSDHAPVIVDLDLAPEPARRRP
jgi:exodeoxyribonuclease III